MDLSHSTHNNIKMHTIDVHARSDKNRLGQAMHFSKTNMGTEQAEYMNAYKIIIIIVIIHTFLYCHKVVTSEAVYSPAFTGTKLYRLVTSHIGVSSLPNATAR